MNAAIATTLAFVAGSLPFSVWLAQLALQKDIRGFGDGNPGASNVWRAGGRGIGAAALLCDFAKGAIPVAWAQYGLGLTGWGLTAVALAPVFGHAFSPFLRFKGGKALAVTFGIWTGLSLWLVPTVLGLCFALWLAWLKVEGWAVLAGMLTLLVVLLILQAEWVWLVVWLGNTAVLVGKHWADFARPVGREA